VSGPRDDSAKGDAETDRYAWVDVAQVALQDERADRVAEGRGEYRCGPEKLPRAAPDIDADEGCHARKAGEEAEQAEPRGPLAAVDAERQKGDEQRPGGDQDRGERRGDPLFAGGDERLRHDQLDP